MDNGRLDSNKMITYLLPYLLAQCLPLQNVPDVCHCKIYLVSTIAKKYLVFAIAKHTWCLPLQKVLMFAIAKGTMCLHLQKVLGICYCKRYLVFTIAKGTWYLLLQKVLGVYHCKWDSMHVTENGYWVVHTDAQTNWYRVNSCFHENY